MPWLVYLFIELALMALEAAIAEARKKNSGTKGPGEIKAPTAEQGNPIPYVAGTTIITGSNCIRIYQKAARRYSGDIFEYFSNMQLGLCFGGDYGVEMVSVGESASSKYNLEVVNKWEAAETYPKPVSSTIDFGWIQVGTELVRMPTVQLGNPDFASGATGYCYMGTEGIQWAWDHGSYSSIPSGSVIVGTGTDTSVGYVYVDGNGARHLAIIAVPSGTIAYANVDLVGMSAGAGQWYRSTGGSVSRQYPWGWNKVTYQTSTNTSLPRECTTYRIKPASDQSGQEVEACFRFYPGTDTQGIDYMDLDSDGQGPSWPGLCRVVFCGRTGPVYDPSLTKTQYLALWGKANTLPQLTWEVRRIPDPLGLGAKARIIGDSSTDIDANPANILYELLTAKFALRQPTTKIDKATFYSAGETLYSEGFGLSVLIDSATDFDSVASEICKNIDGALYLDKYDGLWKLQLIRQDYDSDDLPHFTDDDFGEEGVKITRSFALANQVSVTFTSREEDYTNITTRVDNPVGLQVMGGRIVNVDKSYKYITVKSTAWKAAARCMRSLSQPIAKIEGSLSRKAFTLRPGQPFKISSAENSISGMVCRISSIENGTITDERVTIEALEDVFGRSMTVYVPSDSSSSDSDLPAASPDAVALWEPSYPLDGTTEVREIAVLAARGDRATGIAIYTDDAVSGVFAKTGIIEDEDLDGYTPSAQLSVSLSETDETTDSVIVQGADDFDLVASLGTLASGKNLLLVDDELISWESIYDNGDGTYTFSTLARGVYDTVPEYHAIGARCWVITQKAFVLANSAYATDAAHNIKAQGTSQNGAISVSSLAASSITTTSRQWRPFPPGRIRIAGKATRAESLANPLIVAGPAGILVAWARRNRTAQTTVVQQGDDPVAGESGQTTTIRATSSNGYTADLAGLAGDSTYLTPAWIAANFPTLPLSGSGALFVYIWAVNSDGVASRQRHSTGVLYAVGYGMSYWGAYGGIN